MRKLEIIVEEQKKTYRLFRLLTITPLYQSLVYRERKLIVEEIALLQDAVKFFKAAQFHSGKPGLYEEFASRIREKQLLGHTRCEHI